MTVCLSLSIKHRWRWHPTPVLLPGKSHGRRSLVDCSPWGREELDMTECLPFHFSLSCIGEGNGNPLQCSCLENPRDGGAWWAAVYGVTQSRTRLKRLSSSSTQAFQYSNNWFSPALAVLLTLLLCPSHSCLIISPGLVRSFITVLFVIARVWKQPKCNKEGTG